MSPVKKVMRMERDRAGSRRGRPLRRLGRGGRQVMSSDLLGVGSISARAVAGKDTCQEVLHTVYYTVGSSRSQTGGAAQARRLA